MRGEGWQGREGEREREEIWREGWDEGRQGREEWSNREEGWRKKEEMLSLIHI